MHWKWLLSIMVWMFLLFMWFQQIIVLLLGREEVVFSAWKFYAFCSLWIIISCSYFTVLYTAPAPIPPEFHVSKIASEQEIQKAKHKVRLLYLPQEKISHCEKCAVLKPPRAHHCRQCGRCVLRMDHHCPVLQNCVHYGNHKFYMLYMIWPWALGVFVTIIGIPYMIRVLPRFIANDYTFEEQMINIALCNAMTIAGAVGYLLKGQFELILENKTCIEDCNNDPSPYDLGSALRNWRSIFGPTAFTWFLPIWTTPGDGVRYPTTSEE